MPVRIPTAHHQPVVELASMNRSERKRFVDGVCAVSKVVGPEALIDSVARSSQLSPETVRPYVRVLLSMYRAQAESPRGDFAAEVVEAARDIMKSRGLSFDTQRQEEFGEDLGRLLACDDTIGIIAKLNSVRGEYERVFCSARILTDVRPVFSTDAATSPPAAAIVHTLRISYHATDAHPDFYVAMDRDDLHHLRDVVDRALSKESSLNAQIAKTDMKLVEDEIA